MNPFKTLNRIKSEQLDQYDFQKDASNVRGTKKWTENREQFLSDRTECEWCGRETDDFDVHHTWGQSFSRQWMKATDDAFVESDEYDTDLTENRLECPECGLKDYYERKTKKPKYRCNNCGEEFKDLKLVEGGDAVKSDDYGNKPYTTEGYYQRKAEWVKENKDEVRKKFEIRYQNLLDEYAEMREDQVVAICSKCHYKEEKTPKKLCDECGENWYNPNKLSDNMCWDCIVESKGLEKCSECQDNWYQPSKYEYCSSCRD